MASKYFGYSGRTCVVTGAASGIGKATAQMLLKLGAEVYALDVADVALGGASNIHVDLCEKASIDCAFSQIPGNIDAFFGIAGVSGVKTDFVATSVINMVSNKYMVEKYLGQRMKAGGAIGFVTSSGGIHWDKPAIQDEVRAVTEAFSWEDAIAALKNCKASGPMGYLYSKRAMNYYIAAMVKPFAEKGIRVNAVLPVNTLTGLTDEFAAMKGGMDQLIESTGLAGRLAEAEEAAAPLVFLCSKMASYLSGVLMDVDYGQRTMQILGQKEDRLDFPIFAAAAAANA